MSRTAGDFILERLAVWGVERVFGYPGDGINGIVAPLSPDRGAILEQLFKQLAA